MGLNNEQIKALRDEFRRLYILGRHSFETFTDKDIWRLIALTFELDDDLYDREFFNNPTFVKSISLWVMSGCPIDTTLTDITPFLSDELTITYLPLIELAYEEYYLEQKENWKIEAEIEKHARSKNYVSI